MRIISGRFKGTKLIAPAADTKVIRPTSDRCREALFSILGERVNNARVLDLFAGTGAFALEAISRGAVHAVMVDNSKTAYSLICRNIEKVRQTPSITDNQPALVALRGDLRKGVTKVIGRHPNVPSLFDIIFLDPPYAQGMAQKILSDLDEASLLIKDGLIIAEERSSVELRNDFATLNLITRRRYGETCFWIYRQNCLN